MTSGDASSVGVGRTPVKGDSNVEHFADIEEDEDDEVLQDLGDEKEWRERLQAKPKSKKRKKKEKKDSKKQKDSSAPDVESASDAVGDSSAAGQGDSSRDLSTSYGVAPVAARSAFSCAQEFIASVKWEGVCTAYPIRDIKQQIPNLEDMVGPPEDFIDRLVDYELIPASWKNEFLKAACKLRAQAHIFPTKRRGERTRDVVNDLCRVFKDYLAAAPGDDAERKHEVATSLFFGVDLYPEVWQPLMEKLAEVPQTMGALSRYKEMWEKAQPRRELTTQGAYFCSNKESAEEEGEATAKDSKSGEEEQLLSLEAKVSEDADKKDETQPPPEEEAKVEKKEPDLLPGDPGPDLDPTKMEIEVRLSGDDALAEWLLSLHRGTSVFELIFPQVFWDCIEKAEVPELPEGLLVGNCPGRVLIPNLPPVVGKYTTGEVVVLSSPDTPLVVDVRGLPVTERIQSSWYKAGEYDLYEDLNSKQLAYLHRRFVVSTLMRLSLAREYMLVPRIAVEGRMCEGRLRGMLAIGQNLGEGAKHFTNYAQQTFNRLKTNQSCFLVPPSVNSAAGLRNVLKAGQLYSSNVFSWGAGTLFIQDEAALPEKMDGVKRRMTALISQLARLEKSNSKLHSSMGGLQAGVTSALGSLRALAGSEQKTDVDPWDSDNEGARPSRPQKRKQHDDSSEPPAKRRALQQQYDEALEGLEVTSDDIPPTSEAMPFVARYWRQSALTVEKKMGFFKGRLGTLIPQQALGLDQAVPPQIMDLYRSVFPVVSVDVMPPHSSFHKKKAGRMWVLLTYGHTDVRGKGGLFKASTGLYGVHSSFSVNVKSSITGAYQKWVGEQRNFVGRPYSQASSNADWPAKAGACIFCEKPYCNHTSLCNHLRDNHYKVMIYCIRCDEAWTTPVLYDNKNTNGMPAQCTPRKPPLSRSQWCLESGIREEHFGPYAATLDDGSSDLKTRWFPPKARSFAEDENDTHAKNLFPSS